MYFCFLQNLKFYNLKFQTLKCKHTQIIICFWKFKIHVVFFKFPQFQICMFQQIHMFSFFHNFKLFSSSFQFTRPSFHFGVPQKHDVATKLISYKRYGEILFQKVASGYLLHFAQDRSSKNALNTYFLRNIHQNSKFSKIEGGETYISPPNSRSTAL